jgi:serine/threonine-protein kinase RsbW
MAMPDGAPEKLRMTNALADLARLYPWLDDAAKHFALPPKLLEGMHVALEEAVMNVAMHSYPQDQSGEIIVELQAEANAAILRVVDFGPPFDPVSAPQTGKPSLTDAGPGGLGLKLLRHFCKDITYDPGAGSNRLTLRFPFEAL